MFDQIIGPLNNLLRKKPTHAHETALHMMLTEGRYEFREATFSYFASNRPDPDTFTGMNYGGVDFKRPVDISEHKTSGCLSFYTPETKYVPLSLNTPLRNGETAHTAMIKSDIEKLNDEGLFCTKFLEDKNSPYHAAQLLQKGKLDFLMASENFLMRINIPQKEWPSYTFNFYAISPSVEEQRRILWSLDETSQWKDKTVDKKALKKSFIKLQRTFSETYTCTSDNTPNVFGETPKDLKEEYASLSNQYKENKELVLNSIIVLQRDQPRIDHVKDGEFIDFVLSEETDKPDWLKNYKPDPDTFLNSWRNGWQLDFPWHGNFKIKEDDSQRQEKLFNIKTWFLDTLGYYKWQPEQMMEEAKAVLAKERDPLSEAVIKKYFVQKPV